ncbi:WD40-repeat-containing domain protein [Lentinula lateritia]|nr:WD40-repeat-containing domain protein [Lentinula lateritia]
MTRELSLLSSKTPTAIAATPNLNIAHVQLRDLVICPRERGLINYVTRNSVVEQDLYNPRSTPRPLFDLSFYPANITSLEVLGGTATLFAAGGQDAELHLSLHHHSTRRRRTGALEWKFEERLQASINNSILLTSLNLGRSNESSLEPRLAISNNDCTVKFFDIPMSVRGGGNSLKIRNAGSVRLNVAVNHSSISPDGTCLLSVGDSSKVYLHRIHGGGQLSFSSIATLAMPPPDRNLLSHFSSSLAASFSTSFSRDGTKYAVASQEGVVCVWDVRSTKPLKVYQTDKSESWNGAGNGLASGYLSDDPYEWTRGLSKAPGWSARNVKFGNGGVDGCGKEIMTFTEHTSQLHVIDARTFETEEIIQVPSIPALKQRTSPSTTARTSSIRHTISPRTSQTPTRSSYSPYVVLALEDTFRIPTRVSDSAEEFNASASGSWRRGDDFENLRDSDEDLVVIPPLGDREVEDDVRALLGSHGIRSRRLGGVGVGISDHADENYEDRNHDGRMEIDDELDELGMEPEIEWDCISSHVPSRSSSPGPSLSPPPSNNHVDLNTEYQGGSFGLDGMDTLCRNLKYNPDLDIAGTCFDPTGGYIYAATTEGVVEWNVKGWDKRWWSDSGDVWC